MGGLRQDYGQALKWYRLSAEQGDDDGEYNLGLLYFRGNGVPKSFRESEKWFRKAAEQDMSEAQNDLGILYFLGGDGLPQNLAEAYKWLWIASERDVARGKPTLEHLRQQMTPDEVARAERAGRDWISAH